MEFEVVTIKGLSSNAYLLIGEKMLLVDTLYSRDFNRIERLFCRRSINIEEIDFIFITHYHQDHTGNLARLKSLSGALVIAGEADAPFIEGTKEPPPFGDLSVMGKIAGKIPEPLLRKYNSFPGAKVDRPVSEGDVIEEMGLEVIALPGHTPGGAGLHDKEGARAFTGDIVSNIFGRAGMPVLAASYSLQEIIASQVKLALLGLDAVYPGHGRVIRPDASGKIGDMVKIKRLKYFQEMRSRI
ncbi:MAG: MBL fold metallo-hydrolase [Actinobacteria bacterium]|nr:MBL fold metallo-hydrolase [Actinomycetota bacterium]